MPFYSVIPRLSSVLVIVWTAAAQISSDNAVDIFHEPLTAATAACQPTENSTSYSILLNHGGAPCIEASGGFSGARGSFARISAGSGHLLGEDFVLGAAVETSTRLQRAELGIVNKSLFDSGVESGITLYAGRFAYNQSRESSITAFDRSISFLNYGFAPWQLLSYGADHYGVLGFLRKRVGAHGTAEARYSFDNADYRTYSDTTTDLFFALPWKGPTTAPSVKAVLTSEIEALYSRNTVNNPANPTRGANMSFSMSVAGIRGDVNYVEPRFELKSYHSGIAPGHVIAFRLKGETITGFGHQVVPPFDRYYAGGEDEIRGFDSWSISPAAYVPGQSSIPVLNADGSIRTQTILVNKVPVTQLVTMTIPVYRAVPTGGDTKTVANIEYRVPLKGPFLLVAFADAGWNTILYRRQLHAAADRILNDNAEFPSAAFTQFIPIALGTRVPRMSTGVEIQYFVKALHTPLRFYWAYNPLTVEQYSQTPIVVDQSMFPNSATLYEALEIYGTANAQFERRSMFRFAIGRTF